MTQSSHDDRRKFIGWLARILMFAPLVAGASTKLKPTPAVTVGPFYPPQPMGLPFFGAKALSPLPEGNDLTVGPGGKQSEGEKISLSGRVMNTAGQVLPGIRVEIWQVDARGHYVVEKAADKDPDFAGYGAVSTDAVGRYAFTTIRPRGYARYGGLIKRAAHIHVRVSGEGLTPFATEVWFAGDPGNERDSFVSRIDDPQLRDRMLIRLSTRDGSHLAGTFDVVVPDA
jgi:protocatechuate 3,4-dioxygenase beta subunit